MRVGIAAFLFALAMSGHSLAAPQTLTGKITDTMCGKKHMVPGKSDAECTRYCMNTKGNWGYGLVVGNRVYRLEAGQDKIAPFAGKQARITGETSGDKIVVASIREAN